MKKEAVNLRESREGHIRGFGGRRGKRKCVVYYNLKHRRNN